MMAFGDIGPVVGVEAGILGTGDWSDEPVGKMLEDAIAGAR